MQLTTDGHRPYLSAVEEAFGANVDYAMLIKLYKGGVQDETKYSPADCIGAHKEAKRVENHMHAVALHYMHYNFVRIHKSLRMTPAMAAGVTEHLWEIEDIVALLGQ